MLHRNGTPDFAKWSVAARTDADTCFGRGRRQKRRMISDAALDIAHDLLGFRFTAVGHEPARAFRNGVAQKNYDQPQHRADTESHPPPEADGNNAGVEQADD